MMSRQTIDQKKRRFLAGSAGLAAASVVGLAGSKAALANPASVGGVSSGIMSGIAMRRVKPGEPGWPAADKWQALAKSMQGKLFEVPDPFAKCSEGPAACDAVLKDFENPYFIQDTPGATQTSGWVDAWTSRPSTYAAEVESAQDVSKAVAFARENNLRLVVKGGAHSYLGQSNAPDSFLIWTKKLNAIEMHDGFVPQGGQGVTPVEAVSVQGGAIWLDVYDKAVVKGKRYVQGGGCTTVGVGGYVQTGGFGSFSKRFGISAASMLEAEVVLADGRIVIANEYVNSDLFWAVRGAGAAYGIITRVTLKLHPLPETFGFVGLKVRARTDAAYTELVTHFLTFYRDELMNPHWGEHAGFNGNNELEIALVSQGLNEKESNDIWKPFVDWVQARDEDFEVVSPLRVVVYPAEHWWDYDYRQKNSPQSILTDDRPNARPGTFWWSGSAREVSIYLAGYESGWLHERLLSEQNLSTLAMTLVAVSRVNAFEIHFNKGLAGALPEVARQGREIPINPVVQHAFGLIIIVGGQLNVHEGLRGHEPDKAAARSDAAKVTEAMNLVRAIAPDAGAYSSEMSYFAPNWQTDAWGDNYPRLAALKEKYDPTGLFMAHHYVGNEKWSKDGFVKYV